MIPSSHSREIRRILTATPIAGITRYDSSIRQATIHLIRPGEMSFARCMVAIQRLRICRFAFSPSLSRMSGIGEPSTPQMGRFARELWQTYSNTIPPGETGQACHLRLGGWLGGTPTPRLKPSCVTSVHCLPVSSPASRRLMAGVLFWEEWLMPSRLWARTACPAIFVGVIQRTTSIIGHGA